MGGSGKPSTPMPTAGSTSASNLQVAPISDMAPPPARGSGGGGGAGVGPDESASSSSSSGAFHSSGVVGGLLGVGTAGSNSRGNFSSSSYYTASDTLPELRPEDVRGLGGGGGIGGSADVGLELRKSGFGHR